MFIETPYLEPCPFCGSGVFLEKIPLWHDSHGYYGNYEYVIQCPNTTECGCKLNYHGNDDIYRTPEEAIKMVIEQWNHRVNPKEGRVYVDIK